MVVRKRAVPPEKRPAAGGAAAAARTAVKEATASTTAAKKAATRKAAESGRRGVAGPGQDDGVEETGVGKVEAEKTDPAVPAARFAGAAADPGELAVLPGEEPWTEEDVTEARSDLLDEIERLKTEIASSEAAVAGLMRDSGDGAGDEADTGSKNITREYEMALAANTRETLTQAVHALQRLDEGTYGRCEACGRPIGKARMQAFPRATLCLDDKQRQERR
jgi:RNA polymerase-binding protein DksA